ncbi:hypothetical protein B0T40_10545 [Chromobacterium haemolyticum]|uniref:helix-turn-helix domain-containing protein n=1 Tax=Chromobacterium haemolyticum TaxID=394935 RepID=UPI0009D9CBC3|nr:hypothetical protein B0T40_10545 [Chromobacterium haemolyticum]
MNGRGERIRAERVRRKWRQEDLARKAGVSRGLIGDLENGRNRDTTRILDIARALGVTPQWLETGKGNQSPPSSQRTGSRGTSQNSLTSVGGHS